MIIVRRDNHMHMIWHYDEGIQVIALSIKVMQRVGDGLAGISSGQFTRPVTLIQPALDMS